MTPPPVLEPGRRRCPDERPHQIVEAALEVFGERGLAGARLDDIAQRAGIAKGTIYLYFPNKEALFRDVILRTIVARLDRAEHDLAGQDDRAPTAQLRTFMHAWWEFASTPAFQTIYRLVIGELHRFPDIAQFYVEEVVQRAHRIVGGVITRGVAQGAFRDVDPLVTTRMIASLLIAQAMWATSPIPALMPHAAGLAREALRDQVCDFAFHALRPHAECVSVPGLTTDAVRVPTP